MIPTPIYSVSDPVSKLPGCGPKRAEALAKLNITTVGELIRHYPRGYQNRGDVRSLKEAAHGETASFVLTVGTQPTTVRLRGGKNVTKCRAVDDEGSCTLVFFNQPYIKDILRVGAVFRFWAKATRSRQGALELYPTAVEQVTEYKRLRGFFPLYPLAAGLTQKFMSQLIEAAISGIQPDKLEEVLPESIRAVFGVCGEYEAYRCLHFPENFADIDRGRTRFMAEELFLFACSVTRNRETRKQGCAPVMKMESSRFDVFLQHLPFELTRAQSRTISAIRKDMLNASGTPMARLVQGDVGSGKTVCAAAAAYMTVRNGWQCVLMAPTEILAAQHYRDLAPLFEGLGIEVELLTGSTRAAEKHRIYGLIASEKPLFVIGTHALLSEGVELGRLGLVITDEQHRFGVMQRSALAGKGAANHGVTPHVLVMSATPIPRTLALILCGDLDVSVIDELPPGRQRVDTLVVGEEHRQRLNGFIDAQVKSGGQVYIVCPTVESKDEADEEGADFLHMGYTALPARGESNSTPVDAANTVGIGAEGENLWFLPEDMQRKTEKQQGESKPPLKSAVDYAEKLRTEVFPQYRTEFVHGRMTGAEKDRVMREFAAGNVDILVSTTVIEVGVNVPNATLMVVEDADRFGLSQLHQLRGRVGRGKRKSYCVLVSSAKGENAVKRLNIMKKTSDGYEIAKFDLEMRGPGDFMPSAGNARQHGEFRFKLAGMCSDTGLLQLAYAQAQQLFEGDPELVSPEHSGLKKKLDELFQRGSAALN
ncbi:MAG: ATP-dependent DNA helicase RecG [Clostridia bacterium]|nr:ATP-dependent DNA helicase RecG [Clostridia bacterium]